MTAPAFYVRSFTNEDLFSFDDDSLMLLPATSKHYDFVLE